MGGTIRLARILGIEIRVHWSWFFIFFLITATFSRSVLDHFYPEWTAEQRWVVAGFISAIFFVSILLHELSHALLARRYGIPVSSITLFLFGGVSNLGRDPDNPRQEFWIAAVGPLTSLSIALLLGIGYFAVHTLDAGVAGVSAHLAAINLALGLFNLVPGYPLDGGRVLRSVLWARKRDLLAATRTASKVGEVVAYATMAIGVGSFLFVDIVMGIWLFLIGNFLRGSAEASYAQLFTATVLKGIPARVVATTAYTAVSPELTLGDLTEQHVLAGHGRCFPVVAGEELLGLVTLTDLQRTPRDKWGETTVYRAMTPFSGLKTVNAKDDLATVMALMDNGNLNQIPLVEGKLLRGLILRADLLRYIHIRQEVAVAEEPGETPADRTLEEGAQHAHRA
jgi:Zn-dependent protease